MNVYLNKISGIDDAAVALLMSKRSWTRAKEMDIRKTVAKATDENGFCVTADAMTMLRFAEIMDTLIKYGVDQNHTTLLRFIDLSFTVEGLHRAGQDDWDAHVKRMDNRIVRASTRLADFSEGEKSDWYKDKILYPSEVVDLPPVVNRDGVDYVLRAFGYVRADLQDNKDVKRGLYPLAIPSNFIFKVQYPELSHIIQFRDNKGHANPEVKILAEQIRELLLGENYWLAVNLNRVKQEPQGE